MSKYVDGFVLVIPDNASEDYIKMAEGGREMWMKHGALEYFECRGDDMKQQEGDGQKTRSFLEMAGAKAGETVWFSFIVFESKAHRDQVNAKVMADMAEKMKDSDMNMDFFKMDRMAYGGFNVEVEG